jgi:D-alanine-D-alanine ligase
MKAQGKKMQTRINVAVIFGGRSGEHEVSLNSARSVLAVLDRSKYQVTEIGITHEGVWLTGKDVLQAFLSGNLSALQPAALLPIPGENWLYTIQDGKILTKLTRLDVVFPVLHGTFGEDGTLQGLLELTDLAYVGAGVLGSSVGMDKALFKDVMRANNIPICESLLFSRTSLEQNLEGVLVKAETIAPYPLFVKPANLGSSVGITKCRNRSELGEGLLDAARYDRRILVEQGINAREIEVSVLGNENPQASIPGEIIPSDEFYSYTAKYIDDRSQLIIPAPLPPTVARQVQELAVQAYIAADCCGMARVDFLLDKDTLKVYLNEINTIPGFTQISMYPKLWEASGLPYPNLVDKLINLALERKAERDHTERRFTRSI